MVNEWEFQRVGVGEPAHVNIGDMNSSRTLEARPNTSQASGTPATGETDGATAASGVPPHSATKATADPASSGRLKPAVMVIFGAGGDLTRRLIVPALCHLAKARELPEQFSIIGIDHNERTTKQWGDLLAEAMGESGGKVRPVEDDVWAWLTDRMHYMPGDFTRPEVFDQLATRLKERPFGQGTDHSKGVNVLFYLAVADRFFGPIVEQIGRAGLAEDSGDSWRRVIIEKPFGHDYSSARALNAQILKVLSEDQIFRIDHFLGKETVQNIMVLRFANGIFEPLWNRDHIDHIQITVAETVGVEGRARFYEATGALRDMVPNHLFQLLAMIGMEPPTSFDADAVRTKKTELLQAIHPISPNDAVRGQYGAGAVLGRKIPDYRSEPDVAPDSGTETFAALKLGIDNWRWAGVPFYLRTGKALSARTTEISVQFRQAPYSLFRDTPVDKLPANILTLRIQPDEGLSISFSAKRPGPEVEIAGVEMDFSYRDYFEPIASVGYETLIYDCLIGDATLFQRADTVEAAWCALQGLLDNWKVSPGDEFPNYVAGSAGPDSANRLITRDGRAWRPIRNHRSRNGAAGRTPGNE